MNEDRPDPAEAGNPEAVWSDTFRDGRAPYTVLVLLGTALHALQILVIAIIMPTVVAGVGGAIAFVYGFNLLPLVLLAVFMYRLIRLGPVSGAQAVA